MFDRYEGPPDSVTRRAISQLRYYLQGGLTNEEHAQLSAEIQRDNRRNLLIFGIWLGTAHIPDKPTVAFISVLLIAPLLFTLKPSRAIGFIVFCAIAFIIDATTFEPEWVARTDTLNCCIYATISIIVSTYLTKLKFQRYLYESRVEYLSATGLLTGLRNRNAFERKTPVHADGCAHSLHCIYLDANSPHEINNAQGHASGDAMLEFIGTAMQEEFGESSTYRIGGDEFVAFISDKSAAHVQQHIANFKARLEKEGYCCPLGYAGMQRPDIDVNKLANEAERTMRGRKDLLLSTAPEHAGNALGPTAIPRRRHGL